MRAGSPRAHGRPVDGHQFDGRGVASKRPGDPPRGVLFAGVGEPVGRLEICQQPDGIGFGQHAHLHEREAARAAAELRGIQPGGDEDFEPLLGQELLDPGGVEQFRAVHVVEDEQGAGLFESRRVVLAGVAFGPALRDLPAEFRQQDVAAGVGGALEEGQNGLEGQGVVGLLRLAQGQRRGEVVVAAGGGVFAAGRGAG